MMVTQEELKRVLDYSPDSGIFTWRARVNSHVDAGDRAGYDLGNGYRRISVNGREYLEHRLAWLYVYGALPEGEIDHINLNPLDNRIANLRLASGTQNQANRGRQKNNTSGYKGVSYSKRDGRWQATIDVAGKRIWLGLHGTPEAASAAYDAAARKHFDKFARPNAAITARIERE